MTVVWACGSSAALTEAGLSLRRSSVSSTAFMSLPSDFRHGCRGYPTPEVVTYLLRPVVISTSIRSKGLDLNIAKATSARQFVTSRRVLVVEDNIDQMRTLVSLLRSDGHDVAFAINGYAALDIAKKFRPEIVLLDLGLPGLDGFQVCSRLKGEPGLEQIRVIALTGYAHDEHRVRSRAHGCELHIVKPADPNYILELVRT